jgi:glucose-1-phosphate thymidylyltransferase
MSAGIREIAIITTPEDQNSFVRLLGDGSNLGLSFTFFTQSSPKGLAEAFLISEEFIGESKCCLILGDNLFHGPGLGTALQDFAMVEGAQIFAYQVSDPQRYGVVELDHDGIPVAIYEKPEIPVSKLAIPGLYFYDNEVIEIARKVKPSDRGELEISSINQEYLKNSKLKVLKLPRGTAWLDTGTFTSLHEASSYIQTLEARQGMKIACLEEIAYRNGWITGEQLLQLADSYNGGEYMRYLIAVYEEEN